jgi:hypothetical protein
MASKTKTKPTAPQALAAKLLRGLKGAEVTTRRAERQQTDEHTLRVGGRVVARVLARRTRVVLYLKQPATGIEPGGEAALARSGRAGDKAWPGGTWTVTVDSAAEVRAALEQAIASEAS